MNFGEHIKQLREQNQLLQRQVASILEIDTAMLSKIERGERRAKREYIPWRNSSFRLLYFFHAGSQLFLNP